MAEKKVKQEVEEGDGYTVETVEVSGDLSPLLVMIYDHTQSTGFQSNQVYEPVVKVEPEFLGNRFKTSNKQYKI